MNGKPACAAPQYLGVTWWMGDDKGTRTGRPSPSVVAEMRQARAVCATCPVRDRCLEDNIMEAHGVWGGTLPAERAAIRNERGLT